MKKEQFQRVNELFTRICAEEPSKRNQLIDELTGSDSALATEVRSLLAVDESIPKYMDDDAVALNAAARFANATQHKGDEEIVHPDRIGNYEIIDVLGEGGMGVVYRAKQTQPMVRTVALKLIRPGMDSEQMVSRFKLERQALALLDHPGIAHVYEGGVTTPEQGSRLYFAMELVEGSAITTYCDEHRLDAAARLEMFLRVCDAVHHAHQRGIIHRDLKPSNIIVVDSDDGGQPKIIDFGVAKAITADFIGRTMYSSPGQLLGTPEYMSPEQVNFSDSEIDTRSDVYALGVLLYELLTGYLPFDGSRLRHAGLSEAQRIIMQESPLTPSKRLFRTTQNANGGNKSLLDVASSRNVTTNALIRSLKGDLDWIVMKCLEKECDRRYDSARALANDIRHHLNNEPVEAGPPTVSYRLHKFVLRHRTGVIAAAIVLLTLIIGIVGTSLSLIAAVRAENEMAQRAKELQEITEFQQSMLSDADIDLMGREIIEELLAQVQNGIPDQDDADRKVRLEEVNKLFAGINHADVARSVLKRTILKRAVDTIDRRFANRPKLASSLYFTIGRTYQKLAITDEAEVNLLKCLEIAQEHLGKDSELAIKAMGNLGYLYAHLGRHEESDNFTSKSLEAAYRTLGPHHIETLRAEFHRALWEGSSDLVASEARYRRAIATMEEVLGNENELTIITKNQFGILLGHLGRYEEEAQLHQELLDCKRKLYGEDSVHTLASQNNLAVSLMNLRRFEDAAPITQDLWAGYQRVLGDNHWMTINGMQTYAYLLLETDRAEEAVPLFEDAVEAASKILHSKHPFLPSYRTNLGKALMLSGNAAKAETELRKALDQQQQIHGIASVVTLWTQSILALAIGHNGREEEALNLQDETIRVFDENFASRYRGYISHRMTRGNILLYFNRIDEAKRQFNECLTLANKHFPSTDPLHRKIANTLREIDKPSS